MAAFSIDTSPVTSQVTTKSATLRHFSRQLHAWCCELLQDRNSPFRQAELHTPFPGDIDLASPPIVFWVNRESFLAGGVLILPYDREEAIFDTSARVADYFGLPCYFTWGRHAITCWSAEFAPPEKLWEYELPIEEISSPATFRRSLLLLTERMEAIFYEHQHQIPKLSDVHLVGLVHTTLIDLIPEWQKAVQLENPEDFAAALSPVDLKNAVFVLTLLPVALAACDLLPSGLTVDNILEKLADSARQLPDGPGQAFAALPDQAEFPAQCRRRLLHYVNRCQQLKLSLAEHAPRIVACLLEKWAPQLGGSPLIGKPGDLPRVVVNPAGLDPGPIPAIEIGPAGVLAAIAMSRYFTGSDSEPPSQLPTPLELSDKLPRHHIAGTLHDSGRPGSGGQRRLNALLRLSWPNHRLSLSAHTPVWVWHFLHLCGLASAGSRLELVVPKGWLSEKYGEQIPPLLAGKLHFEQISEINEDRLLCRLVPTSEDAVTTVITASGNTRQLQLDRAEFFRSRVRLALEVPDDVFVLLDAGELRLYDSEQAARLSADGLRNYLHSTLGISLWRLLSPGRPVPDRSRQAAESARAGLPLPKEATLAALGKLKMRQGEITPAELDQELAVWLGATSPLHTGERRASRASARGATADSLEKFYRKCSAEEIPRFPDNYIYHVPSGERVGYSLNGPLRITGSFFDEITLTDRRKEELKVNGIIQAEALVFASANSSGQIELPADRTETAVILGRYVSDLKRLRQAYYRHAVTLLADEDIVDRVEEIWKRGNLPDWRLVKDR